MKPCTKELSSLVGAAVVCVIVLVLIVIVLVLLLLLFLLLLLVVVVVAVVVVVVAVAAVVVVVTSNPHRIIPQFLTLLTSKCAYRHNGVHVFDIESPSNRQKVV